MLLDRFKIGHHQGKRLVHAQLAAAELAHGGGVRRIAGEVETAEAFDGEDFAIRQQTACFLNGDVSSNDSSR
jgi:hypothetical protein